MEVSPGWMEDGEWPATGDGGRGAPGSPELIEQGTWSAIGAAVSFRARCGSQERLQGLTGADAAASEAHGGDRR